MLLISETPLLWEKNNVIIDPTSSWFVKYIFMAKNIYICSVGFPWDSVLN